MNVSRWVHRAGKPLCFAGLLSFLLGLALFAGSCQSQEKYISIVVDGTRRSVQTDAPTVRGVLTVAGVTLGEHDRVQPDLWEETRPGMTITVVRVEERLEVVREAVPFRHRTIRNEALPAGERRLIQLGTNGEDEVTYRIVLEDGVEISRSEVRRTPVKAPLDEIIVIGGKGELAPMPITGTLAYISGGNAWVMHRSSDARHPLTSEGDLDGRVFALSPAGHTLLYSRRYPGSQMGTPINTLWAISTALVGEKPISLSVKGVLYAGWSPDGRQIAYSTAERSAGPPGWKAYNDLWIATVVTNTQSGGLALEPTEVLTASESGVYSWWGTTYAWSPDGQYMAYARPDQVGLVDLERKKRIALMDFPVAHTYSEWVWVPSVSWSPDSRFIATTLHGPSIGSEAPEDSPAFDLWILSADSTLKVKVLSQVGMWSLPQWSPPGPATEWKRVKILYGQAQHPLDSLNSRYALYVMDRDGSNKRRILPVGEEMGLEVPQVAFSPEGNSLALVYNGNLYVLDLAGGPARQLTSDGQSSQPRWGP
jgi:Tol biopolymer transport system component